MFINYFQLDLVYRLPVGRRVIARKTIRIFYCNVDYSLSILFYFSLYGMIHVQNCLLSYYFYRYTFFLRGNSIPNYFFANILLSYKSYYYTIQQKLPTNYFLTLFFILTIFLNGIILIWVITNYLLHNSHFAVSNLKMSSFKEFHYLINRKDIYMLYYYKNLRARQRNI